MSKRRPFGSVRKLPSGKWQARYRDRAGIERKAPITFATKTAAGTWLDGIRTDMERGTWRDPALDRVTFAEWADEYLAGAVHLRDSTKTQKRRVLARRFEPALGPVPLSQITPLDIRRLVEAMTAELAPQTVHTEYAVLSSVLAAAVDADIIVATPCRGIRLPKVPKSTDKPRIPIGDLERLAGAMDDRYRAFVWLVGLTALRWSEASALRVRSLDFLGRPASVQVVETATGPYTKTDASLRTVPMPPQLVAILAEHLAETGRRDPDDLVFTAPGGGPLRYNDFHSRQWAPACVAVGLGQWAAEPVTKAAGRTAGRYSGLTIHGLRHSCAGMWRSAGIHTQLISRWLGHANDKLTSSTYGWTPDALDTEATNAVERLLSESLWHGDGTAPLAAGDENGPAGPAHTV